jgi:hypothetical protein
LTHIPPLRAKDIVDVFCAKNEQYEAKDAAEAEATRLLYEDIEEDQSWLDAFNDAGLFSKEYALFAILACAVFADNAERADSVGEIMAIAATTKSLMGLSANERERMERRIRPQLAAAKRNDLLDKAAANLPGYMHLSAFAMATDIVFREHSNLDPKRKFLVALAKKLQIKPETAKDVTDIIYSSSKY